MTVPFSRYDTNMGGGERNKRDKRITQNPMHVV